MINYILNKLKLLKWKFLGVNVDKIISKETVQEKDLIFLEKLFSRLQFNHEYTFVDCGKYWFVQQIYFEKLQSKC